mmetsp:Transcript_39347/g.44015  ORF Transcript_39347/g.44015 Transcript_39347/m.44015 type:complete len:151 (-) Transcript_39347:738-1190(-)
MHTVPVPVPPSSSVCLCVHIHHHNCGREGRKSWRPRQDLSILLSSVVVAYTTRHTNELTYVIDDLHLFLVFFHATTQTIDGTAQHSTAQQKSYLYQIPIIHFGCRHAPHLFLFETPRRVRETGGEADCLSPPTNIMDWMAKEINESHTHG